MEQKIKKATELAAPNNINTKNPIKDNIAEDKINKNVTICWFSIFLSNK